MNAIDIKDLYFSYGSKKVFKGLNLSIPKGSFTTVLGRCGSGKSTLFKILSGQVKYNGDILMLNKSFDYCFEKGYVGLVYAEFDDFHEEIVIDELIYILNKKGRTPDKIKLEVERAVKKTGIHHILDKKIIDLSIKEKILVLFAIQILNKPRILIMDGVLDYLDIEKMQIVKEIRRLNKKNTTINITNNTEDSLYGSDIVILGKDIVQGRTIDVLSIDVLKSNRLYVPFMLSLSDKLKFYNLIQSPYFEMEKLVDDLWQ